MDRPAHESDQPQPERADSRQKLFARRALIQAGWVIPAMATFSVPKIAGAASGHADIGHGDGGTGFNDTPPHGDGQHVDLHTDNGVPHFDASPHSDQIGGHSDADHNDQTAAHTDIVHGDGSPPPHGDGFHFDAAGPHQDNQVHADTNPLHGDAGPHGDNIGPVPHTDF